MRDLAVVFYGKRKDPNRPWVRYVAINKRNGREYVAGVYRQEPSGPQSGLVLPAEDAKDCIEFIPHSRRLEKAA